MNNKDKNPFLEEYIKDNENFFHKKTTKILTDREFIKVYINANEKLANLSNSSKLLFEYLFNLLQKTESYNRTIADISFKSYIIFVNSSNLKPLSKATFYRSREELIKARIIAETKNIGFYFFNLNYFFNGDRIIVANEYLKQSNAIVNETKEVKKEVVKNDIKDNELEGYKQKKTAFQS